MKRTFGERLEEVMINAGFNKNSLGRKTGIHPTTLKNWIENKTDPDDLKLDILIKILNTSKDYLYTGVGARYVIPERQNEKKEAKFNLLPINEQLSLLYNNQKSLDEKLDKILEYIEDLTEPFYEYMKLNKK